MKLYLRALLLACFASTACSSLETGPHTTTYFSFEIVASANNRQPTSMNKSVFLKKCSHQVTTSNCSAPLKAVEYSLFVKRLQKRIEARAFISQQIALLEHQRASLQMDREIIQNEIDQFDRSLNNAFLPETVANIHYLRVSLVMDAQELDRKIQLTQADLNALQQPVKSPGTMPLEVAKLVELLESPQVFGNSLVFRDNLFAQTMDAIARELL